eukprot:COSAG02_NODE_6447_length_3564_cov_1.635786_2_plen_85_part_00
MVKRFLLAAIIAAAAAAAVVVVVVVVVVVARGPALDIMANAAAIARSRIGTGRPRAPVGVPGCPGCTRGPARASAPIPEMLRSR